MRPTLGMCVRLRLNGAPFHDMLFLVADVQKTCCETFLLAMKKGQFVQAHVTVSEHCGEISLHKTSN